MSGGHPAGGHPAGGHAAGGHAAGGASGLELRSVSFDRPGRTVLREASLMLRPGRIIAVLGPNGAGKTSLLGLASGRLAPLSGEVRLDDSPVHDWGVVALSRRLALLPQFERLPFNYSCLDFVLLGRAPHVGMLSMPGQVDVAEARAALLELGLAGFENRSVGELSGGELQLVRIARCLAQEAAFILLDEPTSMLDPANARRVAEALRNLASAGRGILLATHDSALATFLADEAMLLREGSVVADGPASEVLVPVRLEAAFGVRFSLESLPSAFCE